MMDQVDVSVVIPTYNHENYIEQCIKSVCMQKVNFNLEVIVGEDCSKDKTREVLKRLEPALPPYFQILYREKNLCDGNFSDLFLRMRGRYFIILEGDDFWTYEYKLQKEYDFLENHPDYTAVAHNAQVVNEFGKPIKWRCHECYNTEYTIWDFRKGLFPGQTATVLRRNFYAYDLYEHNIDIPGYPGDRIKAFFAVANGKVHCFQEKWSAYRLVISHGSSAAATSKRLYDKDLIFYRSLYEYAIRNQLPKDVRIVTEELYMWFLFTCLLKHRCELNRQKFIKIYSDMKYKTRCGGYIVTRLLYMPIEKMKYKKENKLKLEAAT